MRFTFYVMHETMDQLTLRVLDSRAFAGPTDTNGLPEEQVEGRNHRRSGVSEPAETRLDRKTGAISGKLTYSLGRAIPVIATDIGLDG